MYTVSDKSQFQAQEIEQGRHKLATAHHDLVNWISEQFGVKVLDFFCERREPSNNSRQQLVHLILETIDDVKKVQANRAGSGPITDQFLKYFKSGSRNQNPDPLKGDVFPAEMNPFPEILVTFRPLKSISSKILNEMFEDEKHTVLKQFGSVWTMSQRVVFYYTDDQIKENLANGISKKIGDELELVARKYGLAMSSPYYFDSKESFDRDSEGKWHYYWK